MIFAKMTQKMTYKIGEIMLDHGTEFKYAKVESFCAEHWFHHKFWLPIHLSKIGWLKQRQVPWLTLLGLFWQILTFQRTYGLKQSIVYVMWPIGVWSMFILSKTPCELLNNKKPKLSYMRAFGCKCFVLNNGKDDLGKFYPASDKGVFVGFIL